MLAVTVGTRLIEKYHRQFGPTTDIFTKGEVITGVPGSGKSHVIQYLSLVAMSKGLRVMTTALMAVRAMALGGEHMHQLFCINTKTHGTPHRHAELAIDKLHCQSQILHLHALLTMDVLVIDEVGQLSAAQFTVLDIILRKLRNSNIPFGGVLILCTMDHRQFSAINGLPFLLSSHVLTNLVLIGLKHSVRAHGDPAFQRLQDITRMSLPIAGQQGSRIGVQAKRWKQLDICRQLGKRQNQCYCTKDVF